MNLNCSSIQALNRYCKCMPCVLLSYFFSAQAQRNVAVMGASGGIGQPLSLLLKNSPLVTQLSLYDIVHTPGVAADLSHIDSPAKVSGFVGPEQFNVSTFILC